MKLSDYNKLMSPQGTPVRTGYIPGREPPEKAGVECDLCGTEMEVVPSFHTGGVPVRCPKCGHSGTKATGKFY